ncbi:endonuclease/exonuclease/phosphatase family protein [Kitasatospora camelliae]|uniref:Endonuclease/exonuclease/phosphatase family protein n=1 Tax=Kitasatospora camelliae TaxID=3156397 RepID=A0AAU8JWC9_9ACTN
MVRADSPTAATEGERPEPADGGGPDANRWSAGWSAVTRWFRGLSWRRGLVLAALAVLVALLFAFHASVPNTVGNLGSLLETFLPWLGLAVPVLLALALWRRSASALVAVLLPVAVWLHLFGGQLTDKSSGKGDFTVLSHNVAAQNQDRTATLKLLNGSGAQIVALEEVAGTDVPVYREGLAAAYPYHAVEGTVGLWSTYPISEVGVVDLQMGWTRAFRARVDTPQGPLAVYVAHLPSVRVKFDSGFTAGQRDRSARLLGEAIAHERLKKVVLLGDLNGTMNDRSLSPITAQMRSAQGAAGHGFGYSWPAGFPMARIDHIMSKGGLRPTDSRVLPADGSDHRAVTAEYRY